ncbi:hypothetical protein PR202_ga28794 [Eleusine coracana subsp. coracana]|uniref:Uncharacterized protein n=1 Tax=Eleusine coracana subsp. coracana TaxID=191504 RepID=A0AAV5DI09_ELECO|nr:hypothetical protein PR202_ga28794 [Eleusine coracana subsp. coracana]
MDLMNVEELLCCWEKLRYPVFVQFAGRFYGELCMDLFSGGSDDDVSSEWALTISGMFCHDMWALHQMF